LPKEYLGEKWLLPVKDELVKEEPKGESVKPESAAEPIPSDGTAPVNASIKSKRVRKS
jgi:hypothetical protein